MGTGPAAHLAAINSLTLGTEGAGGDVDNANNAARDMWSDRAGSTPYDGSVFQDQQDQGLVGGLGERAARRWSFLTFLRLVGWRPLPQRVGARGGMGGWTLRRSMWRGGSGGSGGSGGAMAERGGLRDLRSAVTKCGVSGQAGNDDLTWGWFECLTNGMGLSAHDSTPGLLLAAQVGVCDVGVTWVCGGCEGWVRGVCAEHKQFLHFGLDYFLCVFLIWFHLVDDRSMTLNDVAKVCGRDPCLCACHDLSCGPSIPFHFILSML